MVTAIGLYVGFALLTIGGAVAIARRFGGRLEIVVTVVGLVTFFVLLFWVLWARVLVRLVE